MSASAPWQLIDNLNSKVERAKKHTLDLEKVWDEFFASKPYTVCFKDDSAKDERTYFLDRIREIPPEVPLIAGDAISNLRSALDHLAHHLVVVGTGSPGPFTHVYFPIAATGAEYKAVRDKRTQGMKPEALNAIDDLQPYGDGAGKDFWHLHCLNNIDKHRLLLTVWANLAGHTMLPSQREAMTKRFFGSYPAAKEVPDLKETFIAPAVKRFPLNAGDPLLTIPKTELEAQMRFLLILAFGEPKAVEGRPTIEFLLGMATLIRHTIFKFDGLGLL
jgi:hypothetical protein